MPLTLALHAMGARFELVLDGGDAHRLRAVGEAALDEVRACHTRFNRFDPGSWLSVLCRRAAAEPVAPDDEAYELLEPCRRVHAASGGAFDVTVGPLMAAWGFHGGGGAASAEGAGSAEAVAAARRVVGMHRVVLDPGARSVRLTDPGVALDLGAIAKGYAIDLAIGVLREHGVERALLHGGTSTAAAIGAPPGEPGWRVRLADAGGAGGRSGGGAGATSGGSGGAVVVLRDAALSVSAPHGRVVERGGVRLGHVLDPRTGAPAKRSGFAAAVAPSACLADAWSTALLVLGERPVTMPASVRAIWPRSAGDGGGGVFVAASASDAERPGHPEA